MTRFAKAVSVYWSFSIFTLFAHAQTQEQPREFIFRTGTRMVHVNVIVQDKDGRPVDGLEKQDFILKDAGKIQEIRSFSIESKDRVFSELPKLPPSTFTNRLAGGTPTSVTVILLDAVNTRSADQVYAASAVVQFLQQIRPADPVAVYVLGRELRVVHEFTNDPVVLLKALAGYRALPGQDDLETLSKPALRGLLDLFAKERGYPPDQIKRFAQFAITNHLAGLPGRKNLVWVSSSIPEGYSATLSDSISGLGWKPAGPQVLRLPRPIIRTQAQTDPELLQ